MVPAVRGRARTRTQDLHAHRAQLIAACCPVTTRTCQTVGAMGELAKGGWKASPPGTRGSALGWQEGTGHVDLSRRADSSKAATLPTDHRGPWLLAPAISTSNRPRAPANMASDYQRKTSSRAKSHLGLDDFHRLCNPTFFYTDFLLAA